MTDLNVPMSLEVKDSETADVSQRVHVDSELSEEIHDRGRAVGEGEPEDERSQHNGKQLLGVNHDLHREKLAKLLVHL